jgi:diguanylate cyclase (GGDEF)-like protein
VRPRWSRREATVRPEVRWLAAASVAWVAVTAAAIGTDSRVAEVGALATGIVLLAAVWLLLRVAERERRRWQHTLDAMQAGVVLYDAHDRLLFANHEFRNLYRLDEGLPSAGMPFEELLRTRVHSGFVPEAIGREEPFIEERLAQHRAGVGQVLLREMPDSRWRRIVEQRLPDGSRLAFSVDVTELVENQRALDAARHEAERAHQLLIDAVEAMPASVEVFDRNDRLVLFNQQLLRLHPYMQQQTLLGETFETLARRAAALGRVPEAVGREEQWLAERLRWRGRLREPLLVRAHDGRWHHVYETPMPRGGLVTVRLDATETVHQREELRVAHERAATQHALLDDAVESLPDGFALYDRDDRLLVCNQRFRELYRESAPALVIGATFESIVRYGLEHGQFPQAAADPQAWLDERLRRHRAPDGVPLLLEVPGNRWLRVDERRTRSGGVAGVRTDVTEMVRIRQQLEASNSIVEASRRQTEEAAAALRIANARLEELSATDALTGLANRRRFDARLADEAQRAHRHGTSLALLLVDIDHFKLYNDHLGHPQGDRALQAVAAVLAQQGRRPGELVARIGGEEFALLLPHADAATALAVASRCHDAMETLALPHATSPTADHVTLSIGAAVLRLEEREDGDSLLRRADAALYAAKAAGRARCMMSDAP